MYLKVDGVIYLELFVLVDSDSAFPFHFKRKLLTVFQMLFVDG